MNSMKKSTKAFFALGIALALSATAAIPAYANGTENKTCGNGSGITVHGTSAENVGTTYIESGDCGTLGVRSFISYNGAPGVYAGWVMNATDAVYNAPGTGYVISKSDHDTSYNAVWTK
jgi:hypothetical protein